MLYIVANNNEILGMPFIAKDKEDAVKIVSEIHSKKIKEIKKSIKELKAGLKSTKENLVELTAIPEPSSKEKDMTETAGYLIQDMTEALDGAKKGLKAWDAKPEALQYYAIKES